MARNGNGVEMSCKNEMLWYYYAYVLFHNPSKRMKHLQAQTNQFAMTDGSWGRFLFQSEKVEPFDANSEVPIGGEGPAVPQEVADHVSKLNIEAAQKVRAIIPKPAGEIGENLRK